MNPPPLPKPVRPPKAFVHHAAGAGLAAPLIAILANGAWRSQHQGEAFNAGSSLIVGWLAVLLIFAGFIFAVVALCGIAQHGKQGLLGRGTAGVLINGILVAFLGFGLVTGLKHAAESRKQGLAEIESATKKFRSDIGKSYDSEKGITNMGAGQVATYRARLDSAAEKLTGDDALLMQAMSAFTGKMESSLKQFEAATARLTEAEVANLKTLKEKSQIDDRREIIRSFMDSNKELRKIVSNQVATVESELRARHLSAAKIEKFIQGLRQSTTPVRSRLLGIRDCDQRSGELLLQILELAESQWGRWHYDPAKNITLFEDGAAADEFNRLAQQLDAEVKKQVQLQGEVVRLQQRAMTGAR